MQTKSGRDGASGFRPDIQVLRALAVAAVVLFHARVPLINGGYVGVDIFFVISGFLIGGHLIRERESTGTIRLLPFWARRVRRLLPAALLVVVVTLLAAKLLLYPLTMLSVTDDARATTLYAANVQFATSGVSYLADQTPSPFQQFWSLSLEEQFYVFWPIFLIVVYRLGRKHLAAVRATALAVAAVVSLVLCIALTYWLQPLAFYLLPTRVWEFGAGTAVAVYAPKVMRIPASWGHLALVLGYALLLGSILFFTSDLLFPGAYAIVPVAGTVLAIIGGGTVPPSGRVMRFMRIRILQFVGMISYSLYLWHWPLLVLPTYGTNVTLPAPARTGLVALSVPLAYLTYRFVERPGRTARFLRTSTLRTFGAGVLAMALTLAAAGGVAIQPAESAAASVAPPAVDATSVAQLRPTLFVPANADPSLRAAASDLPSIYGNGCHVNLRDSTPLNCIYGDPAGKTTVVLFGDSHAAQWFPALDASARRRHERLVVLTKSSCPAAKIEVFSGYFLRKYSECDEFRRVALKRIDALQPATVIVSNDTEYTSALDPAMSRVAFEKAWSVALSETLQQLPASSKKIIISATPHFSTSVPACLSAHVTDTAYCAQDLDAASARRATTERRLVADTPRAAYVNATPWLCPDGRCVTVERNLVMYEDSQHLTATYSKALAGLLGRAIDATGVSI